MFEIRMILPQDLLVGTVTEKDNVTYLSFMCGTKNAHKELIASLAFIVDYMQTHDFEDKPIVTEEMFKSIIEKIKRRHDEKAHS